ncbi:MAG: ATPase domain-containing protein [Candidatus Methanofastidiosia archaeon]
MKKGSITVIEGEEAICTAFSLQFVYRGSTVHGEYGCFLSGSVTLEEIESIMNYYGMSLENMVNSPSIVMFDVENLGEINLRINGETLHLDSLLELMKSIHNDVKFTRLAIDRFDLLAGNDPKKSVENLFDFTRKNQIEVILTVNFDYENSELFGMCDNYVTVRRCDTPMVLFS